jgi:hypothetical protein
VIRGIFCVTEQPSVTITEIRTGEVGEGDPTLHQRQLTAETTILILIHQLDTVLQETQKGSSNWMRN